MRENRGEQRSVVREPSRKEVVTQSHSCTTHTDLQISLKIVLQTIHETESSFTKPLSKVSSCTPMSQTR